MEERFQSLHAQPFGFLVIRGAFYEFIQLFLMHPGEGYIRVGRGLSCNESVYMRESYEQGI